MKNKPQIILLGNGINLAYGGTSWKDFLKDIAAEDKQIYFGESWKYLKSPMPLRAIWLTDDKIDESLDRRQKRALGEIGCNAHAETLSDVLNIGADQILTTNYSYELECAAYGEVSLTKHQIEKLQTHTDYVESANKQYLLSTFNRVKYGNTINNIWHIHGEARKPNSMVLGHYYYGSLLFKIKEYLDKVGGRYKREQDYGREPKINSWIDAFILGDVYILGFGLDLSEIDLWWLLNRKKREKAEHGKVYFYEPIIETKSKDKNKIDERLELIKLFVSENDGVQNMDVTIPPVDDKSEYYQEFYKKAIADISSRIKKYKRYHR